MFPSKSLSQETFDEHNKLRQDPRSFIKDLEAMIPLFKGSVLHRPGEIPLMTNEGPSAITECIAFLKKASPLPPFTLVPELSQAAQDHADDIGPKGISGHTGSNGSSMTSRIEKYGNWESCVGENIDFGGKTGRDVVINLIIDDGVSNRGHRKNIFNPGYRVCGVGAQKHTTYRTCIVIDYAGGFTKKGAAPKFTPNDYGVFEGQTRPAANTFAFGARPGPSGYDNPEIKGFFADKFKEIPEVNSYGVFNESSNPAKYTYTYKTTGQPTISDVKYSNNFDDKFFKDFKANQMNQFEPSNKGFGAPQRSSPEKNMDLDRPADAVQTRVTRNITITNGKKVVVEKKIYTMKDGSTKIVENQTTEN